jgi:hypothetical protein
MPPTSLPAPEPGLEAPTAFAELEIEVDPARLWGLASGKVLPGQARDSTATFGILGCVIAGTVGAVLTLRRSPDLTAPAFAELALAGTSAVLIATLRAADRRAVATRRSPKRQRLLRQAATSLARRFRLLSGASTWLWLPDGSGDSASAQLGASNVPHGRRPASTIHPGPTVAARRRGHGQGLRSTPGVREDPSAFGCHDSRLSWPVSVASKNCKIHVVQSAYLG